MYCGLCRCTCVASEDGLDSAMANCAIAEDEVFCRCVLENAGDASTVSYIIALCIVKEMVHSHCQQA